MFDIMRVSTYMRRTCKLTSVKKKSLPRKKKGTVASAESSIDIHPGRFRPVPTLLCNFRSYVVRGPPSARARRQVEVKSSFQEQPQQRRGTPPEYKSPAGWVRARLGETHPGRVYMSEDGAGLSGHQSSQVARPWCERPRLLLSSTLPCS